MKQTPKGQMTWRPDGAPVSDKLYMRLHSLDKWQPYTNFPEYSVPDPAGFSQGYATCLTLLKHQWQLV